MGWSFMRLLRHLLAPSASRQFPPATLDHIAAAVAAGELRHRGEVCFAVEPALPAWRALRDYPVRARAEEVFAQLRVWDTAANNGVLVYLLLADHRIEIVADRGLDACIDDAAWRQVCACIEERMRAGQAEAAVIAGIAAVGDLLARHCPRVHGDADHNELPDRPHLL